MCAQGRTILVFSLVVGLLISAIWLLPTLLKPTQPSPEEQRRHREWIDSSPYWVDRQVCRWLSLCGIQHIRPDPPIRPHRHTGHDRTAEPRGPAREQPISGHGVLSQVPDYVFTYAPLVHLYSGENFWPSDIAEHVKHMVPKYPNGSRIPGHLGLGNLQWLNELDKNVFLASQVDVETRPEWLHSHSGIPAPYPDDDDDDDEDNDRPQSQAVVGDQVPHVPPYEYTTWWDADRDNAPRRIAHPHHGSRLHRHKLQPRQQHPMVLADSNQHKPNASGYSSAPAVLVLVDKGSGILDAFWFFFYSYNLGQTVLGIRFGNHVGDWEYCMVRFQHGVPRAMFLSEHSGGMTYAWQALEKKWPARNVQGGRPVVYSAVGSHAMYATPGDHAYVLPFNMLRDQTDRGPLWDPAQNTLAYWYDDSKVESLAPATHNPHAETDWFHFTGFWGDDLLPLSDARQWRIFGEYHYGEGPLGPKNKSLERKKLCPEKTCRMLYSLAQGRRSTWYS